MAGGATRRTIQAAFGPGREATTRYGVSPIPFLQIDFSINATYSRPPEASATEGSPQAQVEAVRLGATRDVHVRPPSRESYNRICGRRESFDAAKNLCGSSGATATATSVCAPCAREIAWTLDPAVVHGLRA